MAKATAAVTEAAETKEATTQEAEKQTSVAAPVKETKTATAQESTYKISELAANAGKLFNTRPECVTAALKAEKKETFTVSETKDIVSKFLVKEVK